GAGATGSGAGTPVVVRGSAASRLLRPLAGDRRLGDGAVGGRGVVVGHGHLAGAAGEQAHGREQRKRTAAHRSPHAASLRVVSPCSTVPKAPATQPATALPRRALALIDPCPSTRVPA